MDFLKKLFAFLFNMTPAVSPIPPVTPVTKTEVLPVKPVLPQESNREIMVQLGVVTVRRQGANVTDEVMGGGVLMAKDKVFLDSSELYEDGSPVPDALKQPPEDIVFRCYYGDSPEPDLEVRGDAFRAWKGDLGGKHWVVSHQGAVKLGESGHAIVVKLAEGDAGTSKWQITCTHDGVVSNPVGGRAD